jgi:hypothetical protein
MCMSKASVRVYLPGTAPCEATFRGAGTLSCVLCGALIGCLSRAVAEPSASVEIPFERIDVSLGLRVAANEFIVVRTEDDFRKMWDQHAKPGTPGITASQPPDVDFSKFFVIAFFGGHSVCEPFRIVHVLDFPDRVTVTISHRVQGDNCTCITVFAPSINVISVPRTEKPIDYVISSERIDC